MDTDRYVTPPVAARILKISEGTLSNWRYYRRGPDFIKISQKPSGRVFYDLTDIHRWMQAQKIKTNIDN